MGDEFLKSGEMKEESGELRVESGEGNSGTELKPGSRRQKIVESGELRVESGEGNSGTELKPGPRRQKIVESGEWRGESDEGAKPAEGEEMRAEGNSGTELKLGPRRQKIVESGEWRGERDESGEAREGGDAPIEPEGTRKGVSNNAELYEYLDNYLREHRPESKEDREKRERKERIEGIISASADAARAISNMISVHHYAPNMYEGDKSMTSRMRERFEKEKAARKAEDDRWFQYAMTRRKLGSEDAAVEYQHGRDAMQDSIRMASEARAEAKADLDARMAELKMELLAGKINEQEYQTLEAKAKAEYADTYYKNRADRVGQKSGGGRVKSGGGYTVRRWDAQKNEYVYKSGFKNEKEARNFAATYGEQGWEYVTTHTITTNTKKDKYGRDVTTSSSQDVSTHKDKIGW